MAVTQTVTRLPTRAVFEIMIFKIFYCMKMITTDFASLSFTRHASKVAIDIHFMK